MKMIDKFNEYVEAVCNTYDIDEETFIQCPGDEWNMIRLEGFDPMKPYETVNISVSRWLADDTKDPYSKIEGHCATCVEEHGGGEGDGEYCHKIFAYGKVEGSTFTPVAFFKTVGWYASYDGSHWEDGFTECKAVQKLVVDWV